MQFECGGAKEVQNMGVSFDVPLGVKALVTFGVIAGVVLQYFSFWCQC